MRKTRPAPESADAAELREERLCLIEDCCNITRPEAERKLAAMEAEAAKRGTTVDMFDRSA